MILLSYINYKLIRLSSQISLLFTSYHPINAAQIVGDPGTYLPPDKHQHPHHRKHGQGRAVVEGCGGVDGLPEPPGYQAAQRKTQVGVSPARSAVCFGQLPQFFVEYFPYCVLWQRLQKSD